MPTQKEAVEDMITAIASAFKDLDGKEGPEFDSIRMRLSAALSKLQGLLTVLEQEEN